MDRTGRFADWGMVDIRDEERGVGDSCQVSCRTLGWNHSPDREHRRRTKGRLGMREMVMTLVLDS